VQQRFALLAVPFRRLLFVELVDIGVATFGIFRPTDDIGFKTGGGIAQVAASTLGMNDLIPNALRSLLRFV
jgi:hypothetical protein